MTLLHRASIAPLIALFVFSCSAASETVTRDARSAIAYDDAQADWSGFTDGQCLVAVQNFYRAHFGVQVPIARNATTGDCWPEGACHIWIDDIPPADTWERIPNDGAATPSTYDMIVYGTDVGHYGHIASVDHVDASGAIYVMDSNWVAHETRASSPHTIPNAPLGWYHLRSLPKSGGGRGGRSCGDLAAQRGYGAAACEWNGNAACRGFGPRTADCDHCCDTGTVPPEATSESCGQLAARFGFFNAQCEANGNRACGASGARTSDCDHCCDAVSAPPAETSLSCGELADHYGWTDSRCEWNGNGACGGAGTRTQEGDHACDACCGTGP